MMFFRYRRKGLYNKFDNNFQYNHDDDTVRFDGSPEGKLCMYTPVLGPANCMESSQPGLSFIPVSRAEISVQPIRIKSIKTQQTIYMTEISTRDELNQPG
jgi:hypothetical protein